MPAGNPLVYFSRVSPWLPLFAGRTPILMYHKLGPVPRGSQSRATLISGGLFRRQMLGLARAGFRSVPFSGLKDAGDAARNFILTFDDGSRTVMRHGIPEMRRHGFHGIQFLVAGEIGGINRWDTGQGNTRDELMNDNDVRNWLDAGHEIGSHTVTHPFLTKIPAHQAREEIIAAKHRLEDHFGVPVRYFSYPYGDWNPFVRDLVADAGYEAACTTDICIAVATDDPFTLPRIEARSSALSFQGICSEVLRRLLWRR